MKIEIICQYEDKATGKWVVPAGMQFSYTEKQYNDGTLAKDLHKTLERDKRGVYDPIRIIKVTTELIGIAENRKGVKDD